jgi:hypothetical protein
VTKFIITETVTNYFIVEAGSEVQALGIVSSRDVFSDKMKPSFIDTIGYDSVDTDSAPFYMKDAL